MGMYRQGRVHMGTYRQGRGPYGCMYIGREGEGSVCVHLDTGKLWVV